MSIQRFQRQALRIFLSLLCSFTLGTLAACGTALSPPDLAVSNAAATDSISSVDIAPGWASNSVNAVVFRKNSLVSHGDTQFIAFYDPQRRVVLGKRQLGSSAWQLQVTPYSGNVDDAHNSISIMVDGAGFLHMAWDHHNHVLRYARSLSHGSLDLSEKMPMLGRDEAAVSYPEFFRLPGGDLLFFYRNGGSGRGDLVLNRYDVGSQQWRRLHTRLIDGEGRRNAYWQAFVDHLGSVHLSWVWRDSPDVASNQDMAYARSHDGGLSWETSSGAPYALPISARTAEVAWQIPPGSELINQTSMSADSAGRPYIASYWRAPGSAVPQYQLLYFTGKAWARLPLDFRRSAFSLSGQGTKAIPISRPQLMVDLHAGPADAQKALLIFRDQERGSKVSAVVITDVKRGRWHLRDLSEQSVGAWEPSFDSELWRRASVLHLFVQDVQQLDGEGRGDGAPSMVQVLQWQPLTQ
ncbi:BNR repeat-containing protein [Roseateles oligotrophus]|uniref:BNR repeat-containing protein n=1 Tax=Roseateles oligotrophus TaxID=1769250 RepID=A0ABT2YB25_9BURK|nr:BNR repeat-containing protein [Roseateles oligotrophus]MCV2367249.1 BNR repeat-containing protein [Roseateles oligotrophus]